MELGKLEEIQDLRSVWPHEALDFTPWLAREENMELLSDAVGLNITADEIESSVGGFHVDILASEDGTGKKIIIENQLEQTNHDHLGKLITYAAGKDANYIIWVVKESREEHKAAIEWLNEHTDDETGFFLCELKLFKIGDSAPAVKFEVVEQPNDWTKEIRSDKKSHSVEWEKNNRTYWNAFIDFAKQDHEFMSEFKLRKTSKMQYYDVNISGIPGHLCLRTAFRNRYVSIEIYTTNKNWYELLLEQRDEIEEELGPLEWISRPENKSCRIVKRTDIDPGNPDEYEKQFNWFINESLKFKKVFSSMNFQG